MKYVTAHHRDARRGFTLMEVIIALAILVMAMTALVETQGNAAQMTLMGQRVVLASDLANYKMAEVLLLMEQLLTMLVRDLSTLTQTGHTAFKAACLHKTVTALHQKGEQLNQQLTSTCKALDGDLPSSRLRQLIVRSTLIEQLVVISEGIATMTNASSNASRRKLQQTTSTPNR